MLQVYRGVRNHKPYLKCDAHTDAAQPSNMLNLQNRAIHTNTC